MLIEHLDARLIALGLRYERFAASSNKFNELVLYEPRKLEQEENRLFAEGHRLWEELLIHRAKTIEGLAAQLRCIEHCNYWGRTSSADRARLAVSAADALAWQIVAALPTIFEQYGLMADPRQSHNRDCKDTTNKA